MTLNFEIFLLVKITWIVMTKSHDL